MTVIESTWRSAADMFGWTIMRAARLQDALERLATAIRDVKSELAAMKAEHDPLPSHIFVSRRHYRTSPIPKAENAGRWPPGRVLILRASLAFAGASTNGSVLWEQLQGGERYLEQNATHYFRFFRSSPYFQSSLSIGLFPVNQ